MNPPLLSTLKPIVPARTNRPANAKRCATAVPGYGWPQKLLLLLALSLAGGLMPVAAQAMLGPHW